MVGLELGADDYITKPFSLREFSSRIKAALRRAEMSRPDQTAPDEAPLVDRRAADRLPQAQRADPRRRRAAHLRRVRDPVRAGPRARAACSPATCCSRGSGATRPTAIRARSTSTSGTCARRSSATPRTPSTCSRCAASATASATPSPETDAGATPCGPQMRLSLRNRLALVFFAITLLAIGALYLYVAPGLADPADRREAQRARRRRAQSTRARCGRTVGSSTPLPDVRRAGRPDRAGLRRPRDAAVGQPSSRARPQSRRWPTRATALGGRRCGSADRQQRAVAARRLATGPRSARPGAVAEAALPVSYCRGGVGRGDRVLGAGVRRRAHGRRRSATRSSSPGRSRCCWR